jgi:ferredoxin/flavodoxin---NADP+ reductase
MNKNNQSAKSYLFPVRLRSVLEISPGAYYLTFPRPFEFQAGQVIKIALDSQDTPRMYSICSGEKDPETGVLFNVKQDGSLTPHLARCREGDSILVSEPFGSFTAESGPAWWIATGTGIAPFYSMLRSGRVKNKTLIHGVRFLDQFYFEKEWEVALGSRYIRCCSREEGAAAFPGRVNDYLEKAGEFPAGHKYYLCGNGMMVVEVRDLLISRGVPFANIIAEIYF